MSRLAAQTMRDVDTARSIRAYAVKTTRLARAYRSVVEHPHARGERRSVHGRFRFACHAARPIRAYARCDITNLNTRQSHARFIRGDAAMGDGRLRETTPAMRTPLWFIRADAGPTSAHSTLHARLMDHPRWRGTTTTALRRRSSRLGHPRERAAHRPPCAAAWHPPAHPHGTRERRWAIAAWR